MFARLSVRTASKHSHFYANFQGLHIAGESLLAIAFGKRVRWDDVRAVSERKRLEQEWEEIDRGWECSSGRMIPVNLC